MAAEASTVKRFRNGIEIVKLTGHDWGTEPCAVCGKISDAVFSVHWAKCKRCDSAGGFQGWRFVCSASHLAGMMRREGCIDFPEGCPSTGVLHHSPES